jgi:hypothetical protein
MPLDSSASDDAVAAMLERRRAALHALKGVVATGIGRSTTHGGTCIQIFVRRAQDAQAAAEGARSILDTIPFEVIVSGAVTPGDRPG